MYVCMYVCVHVHMSLQVVDDQDKLLKLQKELKDEHGLDIIGASLYDSVLEVMLYFMKSLLHLNAMWK